ncbi:MAG: hypothetical protein HY744_31335, partial [Deltaproteobacteria bacterium]|nr:hypothetical protein [Deltaproteobacteria bacterium]
TGAGGGGAGQGGLAGAGGAAGAGGSGGGESGAAGAAGAGPLPTVELLCGQICAVAADCLPPPGTGGGGGAGGTAGAGGAGGAAGSACLETCLDMIGKCSWAERYLILDCNEQHLSADCAALAAEWMPCVNQTACLELKP